MNSTKFTMRYFAKYSVFAVLMMNGLAAHNVRAEEASDGAEIYQQNCAGCHDAKGAKSPPLAALREMKPEYLSGVLSDGKMKEHGDALGSGEKEALIAWLTRDQEDETAWERAPPAPIGLSIWSATRAVMSPTSDMARAVCVTRGRPA